MKLFRQNLESWTRIIFFFLNQSRETKRLNKMLTRLVTEVTTCIFGRMQTYTENFSFSPFRAGKKGKIYKSSNIETLK